MDNDYPLIPMSEITDEARLLAVAWVDGYEAQGMDIPGKQKLASDIMNYARRHANTEQLQEELSKYIGIAEALMKCQGRVEKSEKLIEAQEAYINFLSNESSKYIHFAGIHGMKIPDEVFKQGVQHRENISLLKMVLLPNR